MVKRVFILICVVILILSACELGEEVNNTIIEDSQETQEIEEQKKAICGDTVCSADENKCTCAADCGVCEGQVSATTEYKCIDNKCIEQQSTVTCGDNKCHPSEQGNCPIDCPTCKDNNECTRDYFDAQTKSCKHDVFTPCCGNGKCEVGESSTCIEDCPSQFDLSNYPEPFISENQFNTYLVMGEQSGSRGVIAGINIINGLEFSGVKPGYSTDAVLDTEFDTIEAKNVILIGNPCQNKFVRELYQKTADNCKEDLKENEKVIRLFKTSTSTYALVVSGHSADDVRSASELIQNYKKTKMKGTEFKTQ